jgi:hypothetical protein
MEGKRPDACGVPFSPHRRALAVISMTLNSDLDYLVLLPVGMALSFMIWVFWNLAKQIKR